MDWYEHTCPQHGVIVRYSRDDPDRPPIPNTCPKDLDDRSLRCGERVRLRIMPDQRGPRLDGRPPAG
jgi:hypothetical protein